jgi:hypothetical protein
MRLPRILRASIVPAALAALAASMLAGCASTSGLTNMWRDPQYQGPPLQHILVVGMIQSPANRRILEDAFVHELGKHGVEAVPSYQPFPNAPPDTDQVYDAVDRGGYDGVLLTRRLPPEHSTSYVPGYVTTQPVSRLGWRGYYRTYWVDVMHPGYVEQDVTARREVELWAVRDGGRLIWTGIGETVNPGSATAVTHDVTHNVVPELARQGFIQRRP